MLDEMHLSQALFQCWRAQARPPASPHPSRTGRWSSALLANSLACQALPRVWNRFPAWFANHWWVFVPARSSSPFTTCVLKTTVGLQMSLLFSCLLWISVRSVYFSAEANNPFAWKMKLPTPTEPFSVFHAVPRGTFILAVSCRSQ